MSDEPFMPIVGDKYAFEALRDLARSQAAALTAKDAEIERLQSQVGSLKTAFRVNMLRFGASDADIERVIGWATETPVAAPETAQEPRSEVPGSGTPGKFSGAPE